MGPRANKHDRPVSNAARRRLLLFLCDVQPEQRDELVHAACRAAAAEEHGVRCGATRYARVARLRHHLARLNPKARRLQPRDRRRRVRVAVEREHFVADVVLNERERPSACRPVAVDNAPIAKGAGEDGFRAYQLRVNQRGERVDRLRRSCGRLCAGG